MTSGSRNHKRELFYKPKLSYHTVRGIWNGGRLTDLTVVNHYARGHDAQYTVQARNIEARCWDVGGTFWIMLPYGFRWGDRIEIQWKAAEQHEQAQTDDERL
jgi:hypothetical protein